MSPVERLETLCPGKCPCHLPPQTWTNSINQANKTALLTWTKETGVSLVQVNGQRRYGGPPPGRTESLAAAVCLARWVPSGHRGKVRLTHARHVPAGWTGAPPPAGTEVFIGKLPQDVYENVLIPLFQSVGKLYEFRLMMTFSGLNRGFAYAKYSSRRGAKDAIAAFHNFEVRKGCAIVVCKSTEKCELCVDGLAASVSRRELEAVLRQVTEGVLSVTLHASPRQKRAQLAVLKYSSHQAAAVAKKTLMEGNWGAAGCCSGWSSWERTGPAPSLSCEVASALRRPLIAPSSCGRPVVLRGSSPRGPCARLVVVGKGLGAGASPAAAEGTQRFDQGIKPAGADARHLGAPSRDCAAL